MLALEIVILVANILFLISWIKAKGYDREVMAEKDWSEDRLEKINARIRSTSLALIKCLSVCCIGIIMMFIANASFVKDSKDGLLKVAALLVGGGCLFAILYGIAGALVISKPKLRLLSLFTALLVAFSGYIFLIKALAVFFKDKSWSF